MNVPRTVQDIRPDQHQLRHNTQKIQMRAIRKQKVPQLQHLRQRRRTRTHCQHRRKRPDLRLHVVRHEMLIQLRIHNLHHSIHQRKSLMHALHRAPHVPRTLLRNQSLEPGKRLDLAARRVQKRPTQHIHTLYVSNLLRVVGGAGFRARSVCPAHEACVGAAAKLTERRRGLPTVYARLVRVVEAPCHGIEHARDTVLRDAPSEQRVALEGAEGVVLNLRGGRRGALADKVEVDVGAEGGCVEEDQPDVDAEFGLDIYILAGIEGWLFGMRYHALAVCGDALCENRIA
jgi:hypothetical protein